MSVLNLLHRMESISGSLVPSNATCGGTLEIQEEQASSLDSPGNKVIYTRPFLKWAGNKFGSLKQICPFLPKAKRLIEPFTGSGSLFMNTNYPQYVLAESNHDLVALFQLIQREGKPFIDYCASFFSENNKGSQT